MKMSIKCHDKELGGNKCPLCLRNQKDINVLSRSSFSAVSECVSWPGRGKMLSRTGSDDSDSVKCDLLLVQMSFSTQNTRRRPRFLTIHRNLNSALQMQHVFIEDLIMSHLTCYQEILRLSCFTCQLRGSWHCQASQQYTLIPALALTLLSVPGKRHSQAQWPQTIRRCITVGH